MLIAAAMVYVPNIGLSATDTAKVMLVCSVIISAAQWYKQTYKEPESVKSS